MNIKVSDLRRFQKLASNIKSNSILPIYDYLKFGGGKIVKSVGHAFLEFSCKDADEYILVEEHDLNSLLNQTPSEFINISIKGGKTVLDDSRDKIPFQTKSAKEFPETPVPSSERHDLSPEFLEVLGMAANFSENYKATAHYYMYVHVGEKTVCSGDGIFGFYSPVAEDFKMVIEKRIAQFVSKCNTQAFAQSDNFYFFYTPEAVMGFSQQVIGWADLRKYLIGGDKLTFSASASDIGSYCALSMQIAEKSVVTMQTGKFEMYDMLRDKGVERPAENLKLPESFSFDPSRMSRLISALGVEELDFYDGKGLYYVKSSEINSSAIIAKIHKP